MKSASGFVRLAVIVPLAFCWIGPAFGLDHPVTVQFQTAVDAAGVSLPAGRYVVSSEGNRDATHEWLEVVGNGRKVRLLATVAPAPDGRDTLVTIVQEGAGMFWEALSVPGQTYRFEVPAAIHLNTKLLRLKLKAFPERAQLRPAPQSPAPMSPAPAPPPAPPSATTPTASVQPSPPQAAAAPPDVDPIDQEIKKLRTGRFAYDVPKEMPEAQWQTVKVVIAKSKISADALTSGLSADAKSTVQNLQVSTKMKVVLTGPDFDVTPPPAEEQWVDSETPTTWIWSVRPKRAGDLTLHIAAVVEIGDMQKEFKEVDKAVHVRVNAADEVSSFFSANWQWLFGVIGGPGLIAYLWSKLNKTKSTA